MSDNKRTLKPTSSEFMSLFKTYNSQYQSSMQKSIAKPKQSNAGRTLAERLQTKRYPVRKKDLLKLESCSCTTQSKQRSSANIRKVPSQPICTCLCQPIKPKTKPIKRRVRRVPTVTWCKKEQSESDEESSECDFQCECDTTDSSEDKSPIRSKRSVSRVCTNDQKRKKKQIESREETTDCDCKCECSATELCEEKVMRSCHAKCNTTGDKNSNGNQGIISALQYCYCLLTKKKKKEEGDNCDNGTPCACDKKKSTTGMEDSVCAKENATLQKSCPNPRSRCSLVLINKSQNDCCSETNQKQMNKSCSQLKCSECKKILQNRFNKKSKDTMQDEVNVCKSDSNSKQNKLKSKTQDGDHKPMTLGKCTVLAKAKKCENVCECQNEKSDSTSESEESDNDDNYSQCKIKCSNMKENKRSQSNNKSQCCCNEYLSKQI